MEYNFSFINRINKLIVYPILQKSNKFKKVSEGIKNLVYELNRKSSRTQKHSFVRTISPITSIHQIHFKWQKCILTTDLLYFFSVKSCLSMFNNLLIQVSLLLHTPHLLLHLLYSGRYYFRHRWTHVQDC